MNHTRVKPNACAKVVKERKIFCLALVWVKHQLPLSLSPALLGLALIKLQVGAELDQKNEQ